MPPSSRAPAEYRRHKDDYEYIDEEDISSLFSDVHSNHCTPLTGSRHIGSSTHSTSVRGGQGYASPVYANFPITSTPGHYDSVVMDSHVYGNPQMFRQKVNGHVHNIYANTNAVGKACRVPPPPMYSAVQPKYLRDKTNDDYADYENINYFRIKGNIILAISPHSLYRARTHVLYISVFFLSNRQIQFYQDIYLCSPRIQAVYGLWYFDGSIRQNIKVHAYTAWILGLIFVMDFHNPEGIGFPLHGLSIY